MKAGGGRGQLHAPPALPPGKSPRYPLDRRLLGAQNQSGQHGEEKILDPIQPIASHYMDYAIVAF
jgi:hypothetical protein